MTDEEKKVLQAKHRMEAAEARSRVQERKQQNPQAHSGGRNSGKCPIRNAQSWS